MFLSEKITSASPMTLSFISIDRLLVIWLSTRYTRRLQRMIAAIAVVLSAVLMTVDCVVDYSFELQEHEESGMNGAKHNSKLMWRGQPRPISKQKGLQSRDCCS